MDTDILKFTNDMQYKIEHGGVYRYLVKYRREPNIAKGVYLVDNPWNICYMTDNYDKAQQFIDDQKNKKIGVIQ